MNKFYVVLNGCYSMVKDPTKDVRTLYNFHNEFLFCFVGNVGENKNQKQVVDAFYALPEQNKQRIGVLFVGGGEYEELREYIKQKKLEDRLVVCGPVPQEEVHNYYCAADATILTSKSEGFGLSIIEGMRYGLPSLVFSDLYAVPDLYDKNAMITVEKRTDEELARRMVDMVNHEWDNNAIKKLSERFTLEEMAKNYLNIYHSL